MEASGAVQGEAIRASLRVLLLGRANCKWTDAAEAHLNGSGATLKCVKSSHRGERLPEDINSSWVGDLIVTFRTHFVVPGHLLGRSTLGGINFHSGTPNFRGTGAANWAILTGSSQFGTTVHRLTPSIDEGPIIAVELFSISPSERLFDLLEKSAKHAIGVFQSFVDAMTNVSPQDLSSLLDPRACNAQWSGPVRTAKELDDLTRIPLPISQEDLDRRIRAMSTPAYEPYIEIFGRRFQYVPDGNH